MSQPNDLEVMNELANACVQASGSLLMAKSHIDEALVLLDQILARPLDPAEADTWKRIRLEWSNVRNDLLSAIRNQERLGFGT
jgi:hypothetical protein